MGHKEDEQKTFEEFAAVATNKTADIHKALNVWRGMHGLTEQCFDTVRKRVSVYRKNNGMEQAHKNAWTPSEMETMPVPWSMLIPSASVADSRSVEDSVNSSRTWNLASVYCAPMPASNLTVKEQGSPFRHFTRSFMLPPAVGSWTAASARDRAAGIRRFLGLRSRRRRAPCRPRIDRRWARSRTGGR